MIIEFSVANYLSFKDKTTLSLVSSGMKEQKIEDVDTTFVMGEAIPPLLHGTAIYGPNATGKSNLIKALSFFKWFVINSMKELQVGERLPIEPFRLNAETSSEPSMFELSMAIGQDIYRYGFEADEKEIHSEWCYRRANKKRAKEVELFYRDNDTYSIHSTYSLAKDLTSKNMVRDNALLLSVCAQFNDPTAKLIMEWLADTTIITDRDDDRMWQEAALRLDDPVMRRRIITFSKYADLGIEDIHKINNDIISTHVQYDNEGRVVQGIDFSFDKSESDGTIKYFRLAYPIINALDNGKRLIIDELDGKLHPNLTYALVSLFNSHHTNQKHAQLIFTLHDTTILSGYLLRRDQIWFTEKNGKGASELFSLSEFKVRSNAPYQRDYLAGKFGATPITGDFQRLFIKDEE